MELSVPSDESISDSSEMIHQFPNNYLKKENLNNEIGKKISHSRKTNPSEGRNKTEWMKKSWQIILLLCIQEFKIIYKATIFKMGSK